MVKFNKDDYKTWKTFRSKSNDIEQNEFKMVCQLHATYYKHPIHYPCTCSPHTLKRYIKELNLIYYNGNK